MNIQNQCSYSSILLSYFEFEMWRSAKPWTMCYLTPTPQSAVPPRGAYVQLVSKCLPPHDEAYWMMGMWGRVSGILGFEGLLWCALKLTRTWFEWQTTLEYSWLTIIVILLLSISCFNKPAFFLNWDRQMDGIWVSEWLLRCTYEPFTTPCPWRWSCSFLPLLLCSLFFFLFRFPIF